MTAELDISRIAIAVNPQLQQGLQMAAEIADYLEAFKVHTACGLLDDPALREGVSTGGFDLLIAIGGDGTMLRAGHLCAPVGVPILGINLGRFGFLIEIQKDQWRQVLPKLFEGGYWIEKRMMLRARQWRAEARLDAWDVVNEAVVSNGQIKRPVRLITSVDGSYLTTYVADGLIASTPTGSTAYALAAGGPILPPQLRNILIIPVAPHLSFDRAVVLSEGSSVSITVSTEHQAVLSVDGQFPVILQDGDRVEVKANPNDLYFIRVQDRSYFYRNITSHMNQR